MKKILIISILIITFLMAWGLKMQAATLYSDYGEWEFSLPENIPDITKFDAKITITKIPNLCAIVYWDKTLPTIRGIPIEYWALFVSCDPGSYEQLRVVALKRLTVDPPEPQCWLSEDGRHEWMEVPHEIFIQHLESWKFILRKQI